MRSLILNCGVALIALSSAAVLPGQTVKQPGELHTALQLRTQSQSSDAAINASGAMPKTTIAEVDRPHDTFMNRLWIASIFASMAGTSLDAATSWGKREGNGLLASSDGTFGAKGLGIKAGMEAAVVIPQILLRKHKDLKGVFAMGNFGEAGIFAGVAVHNLQVQAPPASH